MTYCVGILVDEGVVLASDSRTNAGIDRVSTFRKTFTFEKPGERFFAILTAGNLSLTQGVISLVGEWLHNENPEQDLFAVHSMFGAARVLGTALREVHKIDGGYLQQHEVDFSASIILAGQVKGGQLRLFLIYDAGNFIEAVGDTNYFQIGEVKYGKPILDRIIQPDTSLSDAAKCALISFDSTMRSNVSVGPPIDLLIYRRNSLKPASRSGWRTAIPICAEFAKGGLRQSTGPSTTSAANRVGRSNGQAKRPFDGLSEETGGASPTPNLRAVRNSTRQTPGPCSRKMRRPLPYPAPPACRRPQSPHCSLG